MRRNSRCHGRVNFGGFSVNKLKIRGSPCIQDLSGSNFGLFMTPPNCAPVTCRTSNYFTSGRSSLCPHSLIHLRRPQGPGTVGRVGPGSR